MFLYKKYVFLRPLLEKEPWINTCLTIKQIDLGSILIRLLFLIFVRYSPNSMGTAFQAGWLYVCKLIFILIIQFHHDVHED